MLCQLSYRNMWNSIISPCRLLAQFGLSHELAWTVLSMYEKWKCIAIAQLPADCLLQYIKMLEWQGPSPICVTQHTELLIANFRQCIHTHTLSNNSYTNADLRPIHIRTPNRLPYVSTLSVHTTFSEFSSVDVMGLLAREKKLQVYILLNYSKHKCNLQLWV